MELDEPRWPISHMTRSGFVYYSHVDDYEEKDDSGDDDYKQEVFADTETTKRKKKKKKIPKKAVKPSSLPIPIVKVKQEPILIVDEMVMEDATQQQQTLIDKLEKENALLRLQIHTQSISPIFPITTTTPQVSTKKWCYDWSSICNDESECNRQYQITCKQLNSLGDLVERCLVQSTNAVNKSMHHTIQLMMLLDHLIKGYKMDKIAEIAGRPQGFVTSVLNNIMSESSSTLFRESLGEGGHQQQRVVEIFHKMYLGCKGGFCIVRFLMNPIDHKIMDYEVSPSYNAIIKWPRRFSVITDTEFSTTMLDKMRRMFRVMKRGNYPNSRLGTYMMKLVFTVWNMTRL